MSQGAIERFMPAPDVRTVHAIRVRASPEEVLQAAEQLDLESLAVVRALFRSADLDGLADPRAAAPRPAARGAPEV